MDLLFIIKKIVANWVAPLPVALLVIGIGLVLLWRQRSRPALGWIGAGWLLLLLSALPPIADYWLKPFEQPPAVANSSNTPATAIVVLGCGFEVIEATPASSWLARCAALRTVQGIIEWRRQPDARLIFTGYGSRQPIAVAEAMTQVALELGVPSTQILTLSQPQDTASEAQAVAAVTRGPVVLVTSASHMPRAQRFFEAAGLEVRSRPADHLANPDSPRFWYQYAPDSTQLAKAERAWYETLGLLWQWLGGS